MSRDIGHDVISLDLVAEVSVLCKTVLTGDVGQINRCGWTEP